MIIDGTFWVAISFLIFIGALVYLKIPQKIKVKKINVDYDAQMPQKYSVKSVPTLILTDLDGNEISRKIGSLSEQQIQDFYNG